MHVLHKRRFEGASRSEMGMITQDRAVVERNSFWLLPYPPFGGSSAWMSGGDRFLQVVPLWHDFSARQAICGFACSASSVDLVELC